MGCRMKRHTTEHEGPNHVDHRRRLAKTNAAMESHQGLSWLRVWVNNVIPRSLTSDEAWFFQARRIACLIGIVCVAALSWAVFASIEERRLMSMLERESEFQAYRLNHELEIWVKTARMAGTSAQLNQVSLVEFQRRAEGLLPLMHGLQSVRFESAPVDGTIYAVQPEAAPDNMPVKIDHLTASMTSSESAPLMSTALTAPLTEPLAEPLTEPLTATGIGAPTPVNAATPNFSDIAGRIQIAPVAAEGVGLASKLLVRVPTGPQSDPLGHIVGAINLDDWAARQLDAGDRSGQGRVLAPRVLVQTTSGNTQPEPGATALLREDILFEQPITFAFFPDPAFRTNHASAWPGLSAVAVFWCLCALEMALRARGRLSVAHARMTRVNTELRRYVDRLEEEIAEQRLAEAEANRAKQAKVFFLSRMSDELRSPLNAIIGMFQLTLRLQDVPYRTKRQARVGLDTARRLYQQISNVIDASLLDTGTLELEPQITSTAKLVEEWTDALKSSIAQSGKQILPDIQVAPSLPDTLELDPLRLHQIVHNLLDNAVKFTETGTVSLHVGFASGSANFLLINVFDTGSGIADEKQSNLFNRFYNRRGRDMDADGDAWCSSGLGLSICRDLARMMNASLTFENRPAGGTMFSLRLHNVVRAQAA